MKAAKRIRQRVSELLHWAQGRHNTSVEDWASRVMDELTGMDFSLLRDDWLQAKFRFVSLALAIVLLHSTTRQWSFGYLYII